MDLPDVSAALLRTTGEDFAQKLQTRLLKLADATDDKAYASRLRLVASGKRPLRTLLADPLWREDFAPQVQRLAEPPTFDEEQRRVFDDAVAEARLHTARPSDEQAASDAADVRRRATLAQQTIREEELNGWSYVHDSGDNPDYPDADDR